jgi:hypothetical protein
VGAQSAKVYLPFLPYRASDYLHVRQYILRLRLTRTRSSIFEAYLFHYRREIGAYFVRSEL